MTGYDVEPDVCDCPATPVNIWYRNGEEVGRREVGNSSADVDAEDFIRLDCDGWMVVCPQCQRMYAGGTVMRYKGTR